MLYWRGIQVPQRSVKYIEKMMRSERLYGLKKIPIRKQCYFEHKWKTRQRLEDRIISYLSPKDPVYFWFEGLFPPVNKLVAYFDPHSPKRDSVAVGVHGSYRAGGRVRFFGKTFFGLVSQARFPISQIGLPGALKKYAQKMDEYRGLNAYRFW